MTKGEAGKHMSPFRHVYLRLPNARSKGREARRGGGGWGQRQRWSCSVYLFEKLSKRFRQTPYGCQTLPKQLWLLSTTQIWRHLVVTRRNKHRQ